MCLALPKWERDPWGWDERGGKGEDPKGSAMAPWQGCSWIRALLPGTDGCRCLWCPGASLPLELCCVSQTPSC